MKTIRLTQGKVALVDDADFEMLNAHNWCARKVWGGRFEALANFGHGKTRKTVRMHRFITNAPVGMVVDHMNHDTLDNRRENLRVCTNAENTRNRIKSSPGTVKSKGVHYHIRFKKFVARITKDKVVYFLGYFLTEEAAAQAYNEAATRLHGEYASLNRLPEEWVKTLAS